MPPFFITHLFRWVCDGEATSNIIVTDVHFRQSCFCLRSLCVQTECTSSSSSLFALKSRGIWTLDWMVSFATLASIGTNIVDFWKLYLVYRQERELRRHQSAVPTELISVVTAENFKKTQAYQSARLRFSMVHSAVSMVKWNVVLWTRVPARLWTATQQAAGCDTDSLAHCLLFSIASDVVDAVLELPWSFYSNFVLEEAHGFNKMTVKEWIKDQLKSLALKCAVLEPILTLLIRGTIKKFGDRFPIYMCAGASVVVIAAVYALPTIIQPMFNTFIPLADGKLKTAIESLAKKLKFPLKKIYEVDGSRRSAHSNAYMWGFWNNKRIVLYDTLLQSLDVDQTLAVLSHELGHWHHNHTMWMLSITLANIAAMSFAARKFVFNSKFQREFGFTTDASSFIGFCLFVEYLYNPFASVFAMLVNALSRTFELQADRFAHSLGFGRELHDALLILQRENLGSLTPDWLYAVCEYSHPPLVERLCALAAL